MPALTIEQVQDKARSMAERPSVVIGFADSYLTMSDQGKTVSFFVTREDTLLPLDKFGDKVLAPALANLKQAIG